MINLDENIIAGCKKQDHKSQMQFYNLYYKLVYNCCYRVLYHKLDAEDAMQDTFIKAFDKIDKKGGAPVEAWLRRIAINTAIDLLKKKKGQLTELDDKLTDFEDEAPLEDEINWKIEQVKKSIGELPDGYRVVMTLHLLEGYDYDEIAMLLGIKESTARAQYARARQKLIELLKKQDIICA